MVSIERLRAKRERLEFKAAETYDINLEKKRIAEARKYLLQNTLLFKIFKLVGKFFKSLKEEHRAYKKSQSETVNDNPWTTDAASPDDTNPWRS